MSRNSDISIAITDDKLLIDINGWKICDIYFNECLLIKTLDEAEPLAKAIVNLIEGRYGEVREKDFPNDEKCPPSSVLKHIDGYEHINKYTEEEWEKIQEQYECSLASIFDL